MDKLQQLREAVGFPLPISSGYRCPDHNAKVSSTGKTGPHTTGKAADPRMSGEKAFKVMAEACQLGFTGIGLSQKGAHESRFVHVDTLENGPGCPRPTVWSY
jgi:zinc D-Ala-D-Ala carboxypeptidase